MPSLFTPARQPVSGGAYELDTGEASGIRPARAEREVRLELERNLEARVDLRTAIRSRSLHTVEFLCEQERRSGHSSAGGQALEPFTLLR